jgi:hypothetical protein
MGDPGFNGKDPSIDQIDDRRVIAVSRVAPGLAQWIALIYHRRDNQDRPSRGTRGARLGSIASSRIATLKNEDQPPPNHETRSVEGIQDPGPQSRRNDPSRPIKEGYVVCD